MKTTEQDIVTVTDLVNDNEFGAAVQFLQIKYNCSQEEATIEVDTIVANNEEYLISSEELDNFENGIFFY